MKIQSKILIGGLGLMIVLGGAAGVNFYERRQYEAHAAQLSLSWPSIDFYFFYKLFMSWVNGGVSGSNNLAMSSTLVAKLRPYYSYDLNVARYAYTTRFSNLAMTDCTKIYFGSRTMVDDLRTNKTLTLSEVSWLAHELTHGEQCMKWGGRKTYAETWFKQVTKAVLAAILSGNFSGIVREVAGAQSSAVHDNMSMEQEANQRATTVVKNWK